MELQGITHLLSLLTVLADIAVVVFLVMLVTKQPRSIIVLVGEHAVLIAFITALGAALGSIFYSNIVGFTPCTLCWWQRIFLYPQAILFAIALWKKDKAIAEHGLVLSAIGFIIAAYNTYLQFGGSPFIPCAANGPSCSQRFFLEFGYVTIPTMSLTVFAMIILIMLAKKMIDRENAPIQ